MIEDLMDQLAGIEEKLSRKFYGVTIGTVKSTLDPMALGRVQLTVPAIDSTDLTAWARVATPAASMLSGHYWIPNPGDEVLVAFENGDPNVPYVLGSLWNALARPPLPSPIPQMRVIRTPLGNQLGFREAPPAITLTTPDMTAAAAGMPPGITIASNTTITLQCGASRIDLTPAGVTITAPSVTVTSTGPVTATGTKVSVTGTANVSVTAGGPCQVTGLPVKIN